MSTRQYIVNFGCGDIEPASAALIGDVLELAGLFRRLADDIARQAGQTQPLWHALGVFSADRLTVAQAARRLGTSRQALQRTTNELLGRGLLVVEGNPDHRASPFVVLTEQGEQILEQLARAAARSRDEWFREGDPARVAVAHSEVSRLAELLRRQLDRDPAHSDSQAPGEGYGSAATSSAGLRRRPV